MIRRCNVEKVIKRNNEVWDDNVSGDDETYQETNPFSHPKYTYNMYPQLLQEATILSRPQCLDIYLS